MNRWQAIGGGILIALIVVVAVGFWARAKWNHFVYPIAPPMPAVVSESMPEVLARLESILKTNAPHVLERLQPRLSAADISKLEAQYHVQLPEEIKAIYQWHNGSRRTTNFISDDFIPGHGFQPLGEALEENVMLTKGPATLFQRTLSSALVGHRESWLCLFSDGAGDGYWYDLKRKPVEGAVFFNFIEDASYVFFPSAKNLMAGIAKCYEQGIFRVKPGSSPPELDEDYERAAKLWNEFGAVNEP